METNLPARHRVGKIWRIIFFAATAFGLIALGILMVDIATDSFGYIAVEYKVDPATLTPDGRPLKALSPAELTGVLQAKLSKNRIKTLEKTQPLSERSQSDLEALVVEEIVKPQTAASWTLIQSILRPNAIKAEAAEKYPRAKLEFRNWLNTNFIRSPQSTDALYAGVRTAILGSLYVILITILVAFPIGIGAAIYLQEYATDNWLNRLIQTNINNLAGVPSIIYGMLGLAVFVRLLGALTSGVAFGVAGADPNNGRTILSAGLTMSLLILPVIIINAQEAIKAVPNSLREAAFGVGASRWQTIWHHVLPYAIPGILTGTILAMSRAFGETAPLVIIGASTYITFDPSGVFSKFTTLPIQIYQWTSRPQAEFRNIAAAAIIVLMTLLLALNAVAVLLRNRYTRRM
jgi:phosphate transport system permease protein